MRVVDVRWSVGWGGRLDIDLGCSMFVGCWVGLLSKSGFRWSLDILGGLMEVSGVRWSLGRKARDACWTWGTGLVSFQFSPNIGKGLDITIGFSMFVEYRRRAWC